MGQQIQRVVASVLHAKIGDVPAGQQQSILRAGWHIAQIEMCVQGANFMGFAKRKRIVEFTVWGHGASSASDKRCPRLGRISRSAQPDDDKDG
jgi:hypothetical protein